jgi:alpha-L-rhamnosidase
VPVNAFIGFYLKMCALMKMGERELLEKVVKDFFGGMVESTGTLWEYAQRKGSHDHGFASFAAIAIDFIENC